MKARQVVIFLAGVFALLGVLWLAVPAEGIAAGPVTLRFATLEEAMQQAGEEPPVNVDSVLLHHPDHLSLPGDDAGFFDPFFARLEKAQDRPVRVVHYGDSQIEMDRISQDLREALQQRFGGSGTGYFPALGNVPSASIYKTAKGGFAHYTMYGDSTTARAGHNRYGLLAQVVQLSGGGTISLRASGNRNARESVKTFRSIKVLYGRAGSGFSVKAVSDTLTPKVETHRGESGLTLQSWTFPREVEKATLRFTGNAEIYAVGADGAQGAAVDNVPLRGCSGTIFHRISKPLMADSFQLSDVGLIILQFGGNYMPIVRNTKIIEQYQEQIAREIRYFHEVAPGTPILFIGPSDMGKSVKGRIVTWPHLPELVDSLKSTALQNNVAFWDLFQMMGGENSMAQWVRHQPPYAGADYIHFTADGAREVGEALSQSLLTCHDNYRLRNSGR